MKFKKLDYILFFVLIFIFNTVNLMGPLTIGLGVSVLVVSLVVALVLGTLSNFVRKLLTR